ncbi:hypothetical protein BH24ACT26_BH24ACT26_10610 [soil metagenome]
MALTEERLRERSPEVIVPEPEVIVREPKELDGVLDAPPQPAVRAPAEADAGRRQLLFAWIAGITLLFVFAPVPDEASVPMWASVVSLAFLSALAATLFALASGRPWGLKASAVTAGSGIVLAAACAQTGHHAGSWWAAELVAFGALTALTARAARRHRPAAAG